MSLSQKIAAAVEPLAHARPGDAELPREVAVEDGGRRLAVHLTAAGPVGLAFSSLDFTPADRADRAADALRAWADRLAAKVTYLMEPLVVVEHDREAGELALRSGSPTVRKALRSYYEVLARRDGSVRLSRWAYDETARRRSPATCQMTVEAVERLADDLASCDG